MLRKINLLLAVFTFLALTNGVFASVTIDLSTGVNVGAAGNPLYPTTAGTRDDYWFVRSTPSGVAAPNTKSWIRASGAWNSIAGTLPIYANTDASGTSEYERCFCITDLAGATLSLTMRADNKANLFLNSYFANPIMQALTNDTFNTSKPAVTFQYTGKNGLKLGKNCIRVRVNNEGSLTGFALKATLQAGGAQDVFRENGCCQQGAAVFSEALKIAPLDDLNPLKN